MCPNHRSTRRLTLLKKADLVELSSDVTSNIDSESTRFIDLCYLWGKKIPDLSSSNSPFLSTGKHRILRKAFREFCFLPITAFHSNFSQLSISVLTELHHIIQGLSLRQVISCRIQSNIILELFSASLLIIWPIHCHFLILKSRLY